MVRPNSPATVARMLRTFRISGNRRWLLTVAGLLGLLVGVIHGAPGAAQDDSAAEIVYVVPIQGTIEPGIQAFLDRSLSEAEDAGAAAVILDINTPGGRLDTVLAMRDAILGSPDPGDRLREPGGILRRCADYDCLRRNLDGARGGVRRRHTGHGRYRRNG